VYSDGFLQNFNILQLSRIIAILAKIKNPIKTLGVAFNSSPLATVRYTHKCKCLQEVELKLEMYGASDVGKVRKTNQDSFYCNALQGMAIVADGIGGRKGGEVASRIAVDGMRRAIVSCEQLRHEEINPFLVSAVDTVNSEIITSGNVKGLPGMGTTLECAMFVGDRVHLAHVGDSRTYLFYKGQFWQLTIDHNLKTFIDRGWMIKSEIAPKMMKEEALVKALGLTHRCEIDVYSKELKDGEIYLTCSDGLSSMVEMKRIASIMKEHSSKPESLPKYLIEEANRAGGKDNVTVVITTVQST